MTTNKEKTMLLAFHGNPTIQKTILDRVDEHYRLDQIVAGIYYDADEHKGCLVGCSIHGNDHSKFATEAGVPEPIAYLADAIFEGLHANREAQAGRDFVPAFWRAIAVGADLKLVSLRFGLWSLTDEKWGLRKYIIEDGDEKLIAAIDKILSFYQRSVNGQEVSDQELNDFDRADLAYRAYLADRADLAYRADLAKYWLACRDTLLTLLATAPVAVATE